MVQVFFIQDCELTLFLSLKLQQLYMDQKANMRYIGNFNTGAINDGGERVVLVRATDDDVCFVLDQHAPSFHLHDLLMNF
jgi:hypothetical protein